MHLGEGLRLALGQLRTEWLKSLFSLLGVILGVTFLVFVAGMAEGLDRYVRDDFSAQIHGVNTVTVQRSPSVTLTTDPTRIREWRRRPELTEDDAAAIARLVEVPARVAVESRVGETARGEDGRRVDNVRVTAASPEIFRIRSLQVERGRPFSVQEAERGVPVAVLGRRTAEVLFPDRDPLGRAVRVRGFPYRVVGVMEEQGSLLGLPRDNRIVVPHRSTAARQSRAPGVTSRILVQAIHEDDVPRMAAEVEGVLRVRHQLRPTEPNDFELETVEDTLAFWSRISRILFFALPALVGVSLVVGGIVIMNIMLVSVLERTREIGVRKAVGARRRDVLGQILAEAATLSSVGALVGVATATALLAAVQAFSPIPAAPSLPWSVVGLVLGIGVGVAAGLYPAARAARLDPVAALRHE